MTVKLLQGSAVSQKRDYFTVEDDFAVYTSGGSFTTVVSTDGGTVADSDAVGGVAVLSAAGSDNDEVYIKGTQEVFKFATDKPLSFAARIKPSATAIASQNVIVGLMSGVAAGALGDDGAGPAASYSGAVFCKVDGGTNWVCESSIGSSQTTVATEKAVANNTWTTLRIETNPISSTKTEVHFYVDDVEVGLTTSGNNFVCQTIDHSSATEMQIVLGTKGGAASNAEKLYADYVVCSQAR